MAESLRIIILEDNPADAELIQFELQEAGLAFTAKVVMTENDFVREMRQFSPDLILSDYDLHGYNGALALTESRKSRPDIPFILVTGAVSEDRAIEILTQGAKDYVLKSRLEQRLVPAVRRALAEANQQKARKKAEEELREAHRNLEAQVEKRTLELKKEIEHRSRIEASLLKYNEQLEILSFTASQLLASDRPQQVVEELCGKVMKFLECDVFFNFIVDNHSGRLHLNACAGIGPETEREIEWLNFGQAVCGCVAQGGRRIVAENIPTTPDVRTELVKSLGIKAYACHPLIQQNKVIGTLSFGTRTRTNFSGDDLAMMKAVADQVSIAMVRVYAEDKLRQISERFEMAQQAAEVGTWDWNVVTGHIEWSDQMFNLFRLDQRENAASFELWRSIIHPQDNETASLRINEALLQKTTLNSEYRIVLPDGDTRWINAIGEGQYDSQGRPIRMIGICTDITDSKKVEEALRESEERYRELVQSSPEAIIVHRDGQFLYANPAALRLYGAESLDQLQSKTVLDLIAGDERTGIATRMKQVEAGERIPLRETKLMRLDGRVIPVESVGGPVIYNGKPAVQIIIRDVTERKKAAEAFSQSQKTFFELVERSPFGTYVVDSRFRIAQMNTSSQTRAFQNVQPVIGRDFAEAMRILWPEPVAAEIIAAFRHTLETGEPYYSPRFTNPRNDVTIVESYEWELHRMVLPDGQHGVICYYFDSTKLREAEEALRESELFLKETQEVARLGGWKANPESNFLMWTEGVNRLLDAPLDYKPDIIEGMKFYVPQYRPIIWDRIMHTLTTNEPFVEECELIAMSGRHFWAEVRGLSSESEGEATYVTGTIQDISDRKLRENEREQYNRTLKALSRSSQVMMRATDEHAYMEEICKIIVEDCGYTMVWIGFAENDKGKMVRPFAFSGFDEGYIDSLKITWADTERGRGPTGTAIRTGKPATCRNMLTDPRFEPWRKEAIKRGYASSIVLPLMANAKAFGALTIYSKEPDSFAENEEKLLAELANDLSYGITAIRLREALRESEERFRAIAANTPDHILVQDSDLRYQLVINPQIGLAENDMLGKTDYDILDIKDADRITAIKQKVLETGEAVSLESSLINSCGELEFFEGAYVPKLGLTGGAEGIIGYFRNVTERKKTEAAILQAKDEWERTFDTVPDLIAILDKEYRIVRVNKAMARRLKLTPDQCIGTRCYEAVHGLSCPPQFCPHVLTCRDGGEHVAEVHEAVLGGDFMVSTTPLCDPEGRLLGSVHVARDITARKAAEDQLAKQSAKLSERTIQLEEINNELESFSYSISHDLRAPLRAIDGFSRIILRREQDKFDEKTSHQFEMIRKNVHLMGVLIEDILSFSRVQKTGMSISAIDMDKLAREIWNEIKAANKERKIEFKIKKLKPGYGDLNLIKQVLVNLLSNAAKFTKNKKQGVIEMNSRAESGKTVYCVKDNGAGFDMAHYDKLFGVFQRLHSSEEYEGTGIGLAIVQRIVSRHGGRVWAESEVEKGATFYFTLNNTPVDGDLEAAGKAETIAG